MYNSFFKKMKKLKQILQSTGAGKMLMVFTGFVFVDAFIIYICDPAVKTYGDAVWYCYDVISTTGFGDVVVSTRIARLCSVILTAYSILVIAIVTGVVVSFYIEITKEKNKEADDPVIPSGEKTEDGE